MRYIGEKLVEELLAELENGSAGERLKTPAVVGRMAISEGDVIVVMTPYVLR